ncbi:PD-(D/E)XK nuclease family protein [Brachybacterium huguangmaarense]|uniref:DNA 3'-5' helicase n=1 Tax=Brachybacterium huguangmaarense TaxID=1652028 RepID=A0ABY6G0R9_9MICO|nr:UrvD/REP family ATP-dependent DNA helicase [Brachybacterium huguangmaarense]UYG16792.1 PD-(D/E)XK nuclease family protein [Brachybacterium huguangmaarense]
MPAATSRPDASRARVRLLPPDPAAVPHPLGDAALPAQRRALAAFARGEDVLVHGAPGSGRTRLALTAALEASGAEVLLLSPRRASAGLLRDAVAQAGGVSRVRVATPAAYGFSVVRAAAARDGRGEPTLVTGAEQDALVRDLISSVETWEVDVDAATRTLPGFRAELRDVISRANELGLLPADLEHLAARRGRTAWWDAAHVLRLYLDVLDLEAAAALDAGPRHDAGAMVRRAAEIVAAGPSASGAAVGAVGTVVVDDAQDLTAAGIALVRALRDAGAHVLVTSCPDAVVDSFRGAVPDAARRILPVVRGPRPGRAVHEAALPAMLRSPRGARPVLESLRGRLPLAGAPAASRRGIASSRDDGAAPAGTADVPGAVSVLRCASPIEEARQIAGVLRDLHHAHAVAYDEMAIVCRSGAAVDDLADLLQREGLPVTAARRPRALRDERVVADLLGILEIALAGTVPTPEHAAELLRGPFGDADALRLRRIRRLLLHAHDATEASDAPQAGRREGEEEPPTTGSAELLARALVEEHVPGLPEPRERDRAAAPVHRVRRMIAAVRALGPAPAAVDALWAAWDAAQVAEGWRTASLETDDLDGAGARGRLAARRLDAVTALFAAVERFTERRPGADASGFVEQIRDQAVAEDTLAPRAPLTGRVRVLTPAAVAGEEVDTVVLAHVQEGAWPNTRLRSTLFGAAELALAAEDPELPTQPSALRAVQREGVIADELRLAVSALARARTRLLVTAVENDDESPSALVEVIERGAGPGWVDPDAAAADPGPAPDPRRLVAALRQRLADLDPAETGQDRSAALLAALAAAGAPGADPALWYHQEPSSTTALLAATDPVTLSPSALERAHDCPQAWLLERAGGSPSSGPAQTIGTAVHRIAQDHPAGSEDVDADGSPRDLLAELSLLLAPLHLDRTWSTRRLLGRAEDSVRLLSQHLAVTGMPLAVEAPFTVRHGDVELRGTIDRIEGDTTGLRVVDLKTGRAAKSAVDAAVDLQLAAYQSAIRDGALADVLGEDAPERLHGAQLVYVGTGTRKPAVRTQGALTDAENPRWFDEIVEDVAEQVRGSHVTARPNRHCDHCSVRRTCTLWPEGAQL